MLALLNEVCVVSKRLTTFLPLILFLQCASSAYAQSYRVLKVTPNGQAFEIPLTAADRGRDILVLAESTRASAMAVRVGLGGVQGVTATVSSVVVGSSVSAESLNPDTAFSPVALRDSDGKPITRIGVAGSNAGGSETCLSKHNTSEELSFIASLRQIPYYSGKSDEQICRSVFADSGGSDPDTGAQFLKGSGIIFRSACSLNQKIVALVRISTADIESSAFDGTRSIHMTVALRAEDNKAKFLRFKIAAGYEKGASYYLSPALNLMYVNRYGMPESDLLFMQRHDREGTLQSSVTGKTRPLFGSVQYNISRDVSAYLKKTKNSTVTFTTVSYTKGQVYSACIKPGSINRCTKAYAKRHGISCGGL
ncbi:MAG: hypothetical protein EBZ48_00840 [Proteobacteria bacterium]|nr:hypothetical protein [Pseudomonadota bacterium]